MTLLNSITTPAHSAFLIKLWIDDTASDDDQPEMDRVVAWRGQIQHVQTGESRAFRGPFQMLAFMDRFLMPRDPEDFHLVTRNEDDFQSAGVPIVNPWK